MKLTPQQQQIQELVLKETPQGVYDMVLNGKLSQFPRGFWSVPENYDYAKACLIHLVQDILHFDKQTILDNFLVTLLADYRLLSVTKTLFNSSTFKYIDYTYPNIFKAWEFRFSARDTFNEKTMQQAVRYVYTEKYKWDRNFVIKTYNNEFFTHFNICNLSKVASLYDIINSAFPREFQPWEFKKVKSNYWTTKTVIEATRWLFTKRYKWNRQFVLDNFNNEFLIKHGLNISNEIKKYNYNLLEQAFPNVFQPWELHKLPRNYWNNTRLVEALQWTFTKKYKYSREFVIKNYTREFLVKEGLASGFDAVEASMYDILNMSFPFEFKPWELTQVPRDYWNDETLAECIRWLFTEKYSWSHQFVVNNYSTNFLIDNGLNRLFSRDFNMWNTLNKAFPNEFSITEFPRLKEQ